MLDRPRLRLLSLAAALFLWACGGGAEGTSCVQDKDCSSGLVCIESVCRKAGAAPGDGGAAGGDAAAPTDGGTKDEGMTDDGGAKDQGTEDDTADAETPDAGDGDAALDASDQSDSSDLSDGGEQPGDGGASDASSPPDAGVPDGGVADTGTIDAGQNDAGGTTDTGAQADGGLTASKCWEHKSCPTCVGPDYDQFNPIIGSHCMGTNHQDIAGIEKVVFLGDSVTVGTPPTYSKGYRFTLGKMLQDKFGQIENKSCAEWGARTDDLLKPSNQQIINCFPNLPEQKRTLVVMTVGGNDMFAWQKKNAEGATVEEIMVMVETAITDLRDAIAWLLDPSRFPNGIYIMFGNNYEYSDGTGDLLSCPTARLAGVTENWPEGAGPVIYFNEQYMKAAVDFKIDMIFMLENFCGHGFHYDDPTTQCYEPGAELWFDITCIHPNPTGHEVIANMFMAVVNE